jgi:glycine cleavage system aminomethyltransferase T
MIRTARACGCKGESPIKQTALFNRHRQSCASWIEHHGWQVPAYFSEPGDEAARVRESVGLADVSWMLKFDVKGYGLKKPLALGEGAFSWVLGPLHALVTCNPPRRREVMDRFQGLQTAGAHLSLPPSVYVTEVTSAYAQFLLAGPRCRQVLGKLTSLNLSETSLRNLDCGQSSLTHVHAIILRHDLDEIPAYELLVSREYGESVWDSVLHAGDEFHLSAFGLHAQQLLNV